MRQSNYDKLPAVQVSSESERVAIGWDRIVDRLREEIARRNARVVVVETYPGTLDGQIVPALERRLRPTRTILAADALKPTREIEAMTRKDVTDDPVFGVLTQLTLADFFDDWGLARLRGQVASGPGLTMVYGVGASLIHPGDLLVYADLARWEIQLRMRRSEIANLGLDNRSEKWSLKYKRGYFVDWRVADRHKRALYDRIDLLLDTNAPAEPKLISGADFRGGLRVAAKRPFRVVPFFDPAPWGGQWMKDVCDLDRSVANFGWCFDCVPEENSLLLGFGGARVEVPSIDLVFAHPKELLGETVYARFGAEFPIRFDFLDTMGGGNLSFQVHPLTDYIRRHFGLAYTQDESYYLLDAGPGGSVYLGLREGIDRSEMIRCLRKAEWGDAGSGGHARFDVDRFANRFPARKHDHFLIPAGTVHCSGANSMVLEISATPYIFTFKLWDWGRLGLDGTPRPVHLDHGIANIQWERTTSWVQRELVNRITPLAGGEGWREERTGLHELEFIETRRHWFEGPVPHDTNGGLNVLNLVEGEEAIVESPSGAFAPLVVHYAETFIVPASVGAYTIRPHGRSRDRRCATVKAFVRA